MKHDTKLRRTIQRKDVKITIRNLIPALNRDTKYDAIIIEMTYGRGGRIEKLNRT